MNNKLREDILKLILEVVEKAIDNTYPDSISQMHELKYVLENILLSPETPISEEMGGGGTSPQVDIATIDVKKDEKKLTSKRSTMSDTKDNRSDNEETVLDAEDQEYLQEWLQQKLSHYGLTPNQREKFALKIMNIFKPYLRTYTGTTQVATQVKQNIERNALIDFMDWFNNNGDRVSDGSVIKSPDVEKYLKEQNI